MSAHRHPGLAAAVLWTALGASAAAGQNLLVNPDFNTDVKGWENPNPFQPPPVFDPTLDVDGSAASGSARLRSAPNAGPAICQCINAPLPQDVSYDFGGWVYVQPGQAPAASLIFSAEYFLETGCVAPNLGLQVSPELLVGAAGGAWKELRGGGISGIGATSNSVRLCLSALSFGGGGVAPLEFNVDHLFFEPTARVGCEPRSTVLCLNQSRFSVRAIYTLPAAPQLGLVAHVQAVSPESGYLWFFTSDNLEMTVKVIDGCAVNGAYWVFASGLTDLGVQLTVYDTATNLVKSYTSAMGQPFPIVQDTAAFASCP